LVLLGVFIAVVLELCGIASLPFAVGVYLPISSSTPIFIGGVLRWIVDKLSKSKNEDSSPGILFSSGLIAGGSIAGILLALVTIKENWSQVLDMSHRLPEFSQSPLVAAFFFMLLALLTVRVGLRVKS
jgi:uncharacterized oligopeptide transporter (OPT) family protein